MYLCMSHSYSVGSALPLGLFQFNVTTFVIIIFKICKYDIVKIYWYEDVCVPHIQKQSLDMTELKLTTTVGI